MHDGESPGNGNKQEMTPDWKYENKKSSIWPLKPKDFGIPVDGWWRKKAVATDHCYILEHLSFWFITHEICDWWYVGIACPKGFQSLMYVEIRLFHSCSVLCHSVSRQCRPKITTSFFKVIQVKILATEALNKKKHIRWFQYSSPFNSESLEFLHNNLQCTIETQDAGKWQPIHGASVG